MNEFEDFTIGKVSMIMDDIINGEADKEDAKQLLNYVAYLKKNNLPIPKMLDDFFKERYEQVLLQNKSYAQSIGLKKSRGRLWAHPAISDGKLFIRDQELLYCFEIR